MTRRTGQWVVSLGRACDGACVFCAQEGLQRDVAADGAVEAALEEGRASGASGVTFVGGEPGADARLEALVARARAVGYVRAGVQTNGRALGQPGRLEALAQAGLTDVHLSLHGAEARVHDWHAGAPGAFEAAMRTMAAARAAGLTVVVATVLTRSVFRALAPMPRLLAARGASAWCIEVPRWRGRAATAADRVVPRLALAMPFALHALDAAAAVGLPAFVRGAPRCLLGPFTARAIESAPRGFGDTCGACPSRGACAGVDAEYLTRFGEEELAACAPVARPRNEPPEREAALRSLFVGVGELAPALETERIPPPPQHARLSLPLLGRPAAAHAEVPASAPKKSGEALRAILPTLFDGDGSKR